MVHQHSTPFRSWPEPSGCQALAFSGSNILSVALHGIRTARTRANSRISAYGQKARPDPKAPEIPRLPQSGCMWLSVKSVKSKLGFRNTHRCSSMNSSDLHPWRVLRSVVLDLNSYEVPKVIDRAGINVDWSLTTQKDFSDKMRIAAYRPKIDVAYAELNDEARLRAAFVVTDELVKRGHSEQLDGALRAIGWRLEEGQLTPDSADVKELFFPRHRQHDAYTEIRSILQSSARSTTVVDPYIDQSVLKLLASALKPGMMVRILTAKIPADFPNEMKAWRAQYKYATLEVHTTKEFHDRFIVLDNATCWHIGCSIKDAGSKAFMLSKIEDDGNRISLLKQINDSWNAGIDIP